MSTQQHPIGVEDAAMGEMVRRDLVIADSAAVPFAQLRAALAAPDDAVAGRVISVLLHHGREADVAAVRQRLESAGFELRQRFPGALATADLIAWLADGETPYDARRAFLFELERRGALADDVILQVLADDDRDLAMGAANLLIYLRASVPEGVLVAAGSEPTVRSVLLRALAQKPRPELRDRLRTWLGDPELDRTEWLYILASLPASELDARAGRQILHLAAGLGAGDDDPVDTDALWRAASNLPPKVANGLVGEFHRLLLAQTGELEEMWPCLARIGPSGAAQLLGLAPTLPSSTRDALLDKVAIYRPGELEERILRGLQGKVPLETWMVRRAEAGLKRDASFAAPLIEILRNRQADGERRGLAFTALVNADLYDRAMLDYALEGADEDDEDSWERCRRLARLSPGVFPKADLDRLVKHGGEGVRRAGLRGALLHPMLGRTEDRLITLVDLNQSDRSDILLAVQAIALQGSERAVRELWGKLRQRPRLHIDMILAMIERPKPWLQPLFLAEIHDHPDIGKSEIDRLERDPGGRPEQHRGDVRMFLRLGLAKLGDRHMQDYLVSVAPKRSPWFLQHCEGFLVDRLQPRHLDSIAQALTGEDKNAIPGRVRGILTSWLGRHPEHASPALEKLWNDRAEEGEVREEALAGLLSGPERGRWVESFRSRLRKEPLDGEVRDIAYHVLGALSPPLRAEDQACIAEMMLVAPLRNPRRSLERAGRFPSARVGFPLMSAAAQALRIPAENEALPALRTAARKARAHENFRYQSGVRLTNLLLLTAVAPNVHFDVLEVVGPMMLELPEDGVPGLGLAHWVQGRIDERAERFEAAAGHFDRSLRELVARPDLWWTVRITLGEQEAADGKHPLAAIASRHWICRTRQHLAAGQVEEARRAVAVAESMAYGDDASVVEVTALRKQVNEAGK